MIALCRVKCFIVQLQEESQSIPVLPPPVEDIISPICILFVGSSTPTAEWMRKYARPLVVRREKVRLALLWLCKHNRHYQNVSVDEHMLNSLSEESILPVHVEVVSCEEEQDVLTSRYESCIVEDINQNEVADSAADSLFQSVVVTDVEATAPAHELCTAALCHVKEKGGGYIQIPHGSSPMNEFTNPDLFPMIYPTLFPFGVSGFEHPWHSTKLSLKRQVKHL
ncbi:uncharacterized protein EDB91DRAFT_1051145, partial [Suillus paluster]|uniref:uncharacterized protein n=1 Tax=Suillus paluster TaxID=48578 RepID=UPI001B865497